MGSSDPPPETAESLGVLVVLVHAIAWLGWAWHPWPLQLLSSGLLLAWGAYAFAVMMAASDDLPIDGAASQSLAVGMAGLAWGLFVIFRCCGPPPQLVGLVGVVFAPVRWVTGLWWPPPLVTAAVVLLAWLLHRCTMRHHPDGGTWALEFAWITLQSSWLGPGMAVTFIVDGNAWRWATGFPSDLWIVWTLVFAVLRVLAFLLHRWICARWCNKEHDDGDEARDLVLDEL